MVSAADVKFRLSGGISNTTKSLSTGGAMSTQAGAIITSAVNANLFLNIGANTTVLGQVYYSCIYIQNSHTTETMKECSFFLFSNTSNASRTRVAWALGTSPINGVEQGPFANQQVSPANVVWIDATNNPPNTPNIGDLKHGETKAIWIRLTLFANATDKRNDNVVFKLRGKIATGGTSPPPSPTPGGTTDVVTYTFSSKFGSQGSGNGQFQDPHDISFDSSGNIFVTDRVRNDIQKFNSSGTYISKFGSTGSGNGQFNVPYSATHDASDNIYVADRENNRIQKLDSAGVYISQITEAGGDKFNKPEDIWIDKANGNIFICDTGNNRIVKFDSSHNFIKEWGKFGTGNGEFDHPHSVCLDSIGNVYISCGHLPYIQKFTNDGVFIKKWGSEGDGQGQVRMFLEHMDIDFADRVHLINNDVRPIVNVWDTDGKWITQYGNTKSGSADGQFKEPEHITCSASGRPHVVDAKNQRVQIFDLDTTTTGGGGSGAPPPTPSSFNFVAVGDWDATSMTKKVVASMEKENPDVCVDMGDHAYNASQSDWLSVLKSLKNIMIPTVGNHDSEGTVKNQFSVSGFPFSKDVENVRFISISTESSMSGQKTKVEDMLKSARASANIDWIVVTLHKPFFTADSDHGPNEVGQIDTFQAMFDKYKVDLVLEGHVHNIQRTYPLKFNSSSKLNPLIAQSGNGPYTKGDGTIYALVGTGGHDSGSALYPINSTEAYNAYTNDNDNGYLVAEFSGTDNDTMTVTINDENGDELDSFVIS